MDIAELKPILEAMIFVSEEPIGEKELFEALAEAGVTREDVSASLASIGKDWNDSPDRGLQLCHVAGGYQFRTKEACTKWLSGLGVPKTMRLSGPALETLSIVAYRQPIVRSEIEKIRGVDSGGVLKTLLERGLLRIVGRRDEPGQPLLYGTTKEFLEVFGLNTLKELPTLKDIEDLMRERRVLTEGGGAKDSPAASEGDEMTEVISTDEGDEDAEVIRRRPLDEDEEEEKKDMDALTGLEQNLKDLRRLERRIFPKPNPALEGIGEGADADAYKPGSDGGEAGAAGKRAGEIAEGPAREDAPPADDCPVE